MFSKSLNWMRRHMKSARVAALLSFVVLIVAFGVVQASGPMRPMPPMKPGGMGMWGHMRKVWYPMEPVPTIKILAVVKDGSVTFETADFPENEDFTVTMGKMYTRGINGIEVGTFNSGDGGAQQQTFDIPEDLHGEYRISIRAQTDHTFPYYAFNWFYNNTTEATATSVASEEEVEAEETAEAETEETAEAETEETAEAETEETAEAETEETAEAETEETAEAETEETAEAETEETAEAETEETAEAETEAAAGDLTGQVWQWVEVNDPVQGSQSVANPENYQIEFLPEGGLNIQADCNMGTGSYTAEDGSLSISLGAMTLAMCQEGSLGDEFVNHLSAAAAYSISEDGHLLLDKAADSGTMTFQPAGAETAGEAGTGGAEAAEETEEAAEATEGEGEATEETEEAAEGEMVDELASIAEIAASDEQFSTLVAALEAAGLDETLAAEGAYTVFAPPDDAFAALPEGTVESLLADPEGALTDVLLYHVVDGTVPAATVVTLESALTLNGEEITISVVDGEVFLNDTVKVVVTDIEASNGIIHVVDAVLIPASMSEAEASEDEAAEETAEAAEATEGEGETAEAAEETEEAAEATEGEEAAPEDPTGLVGGSWQWAQITDPVNGAVAIEEPEKYTAEFLTDGTVNVQADCNSGRGTYTTTNGSGIEISDLAMTRALCEEGSMSDDFVMYLQSAAIYFFEDAALYMDLPADSGTMMFDSAEGEETAYLVRNPAMKVANDDEEEAEDPIPSFKICTVEKDASVFVVTADFPEDQIFNVKMGPVLVAKPMKPMPMPMPKPMPMPMPMPEPYQMENSMQMGPQMGGMDMGQPMGDMYMGPPMGGMDMGGDMWGKPMPPKVYVPFYYEAGTLESGEGGTIEAEFEIPSELAGYYRIQIMMRTDHQYPYYSYNWFYNNDAEVCNGED